MRSRFRWTLGMLPALVALAACAPDLSSLTQDGENARDASADAKDASVDADRRDGGRRDAADAASLRDGTSADGRSMDGMVARDAPPARDAMSSDGSSRDSSEDRTISEPETEDASEPVDGDLDVLVNDESVSDDDAAIDVASPEDAAPPRYRDAARSDAATCSTFAVSFNGGFARLENPIGDDFTIEGWIRATTASRTGALAWAGDAIFWADLPGINDDWCMTVLNDHLAFGVGAGPFAAEDFFLASTSRIVVGAWTHVAASRKRSTGEMRVYVNGRFEATLTTPNTDSLTASPAIYMGAKVVGGTASRQFIGSIGEMRIWNIVRPDEDILVDMNRQLTGDEPGLVGYYPFDVPDGAVTDYAYGNDAYLVGGASWERSSRTCSDLDLGGSTDAAVDRNDRADLPDAGQADTGLSPN